MRRILATIRAALSSLITFMEPVFEAGKWTWRQTTRAAHAVATPAIAAGELVEDAARTVAGAALSAPGKLLGGLLAGLRPGSGGGVGPQATAAAQQAEAQARAAAGAQRTHAQGTSPEEYLRIAKQMQRAARYRLLGHDVGELLNTIPKRLADYVSNLSVAHASWLAHQVSAQEVAAWIAGKKTLTPGTPSFDGSFAPRPLPGAVASVARTPQDAEILNALAKRMSATGRFQQTASQSAYAL